ncbi:MAG TPA: hypothetical protein VJ972_14165, partial [Anaerolineales bacterium]|nr:hypothetical protein [Anaerolineales bacterium]
LILGQVMLAVLPLPFFFIVRSITESNWAGMFAVILSAFGWYMPSHVVDWGKYPALMSLVMSLLVICLAYVSLRDRGVSHARKRTILYGVLGTSLLVTAFMHSRAILFLGTVAIAWIISIWWHGLPQLQKQFILFFLLIVVMLEIIFIQRYSVLTLVFDPYINKGILITSLVILLSVFAYKSFHQLTFTCFLTICLLLGSLFIPVADMIPGHTQLTLMDRPYVEMVLFMPLSLLGGLGLAGLERRIKNSYQRYVVFAGIGLILIHAIVNHEFYPWDCCVIVGNDDVAAMAWMENQLPVDARIGVASTELKVVAADIVEGYVGADAGIWVTPLIERPTFLLLVESEFDQPTMLDFLCEKKIEYLFVGELGQTFDIEKLDLRPAWYRPLLSMSGTRVYEVTGC